MYSLNYVYISNTIQIMDTNEPYIAAMAITILIQTKLII